MLHKTSFQIISIYCIALSPLFDLQFLITPLVSFLAKHKKRCVLSIEN